MLLGHVLLEVPARAVHLVTLVTGINEPLGFTDDKVLGGHRLARGWDLVLGFTLCDSGVADTLDLVRIDLGGGAVRLGSEVSSFIVLYKDIIGMMF